MKPIYSISPKIIRLIATISEKLGEVKSARLLKVPTELRKKNRIKTIQSSLGIEGNTLTTEQVTALLENKQVVAPQKDIIEVTNAIYTYEKLQQYDVYSLDSMLDAHQDLMKNLIETAGKLRVKSVVIVKGSEIAHIPPSDVLIKPLLENLFNYLINDDELLLIKSCVFNYELEFIHPFIDGNGRIGRLWQSMILKEYSPVFEFLPIETLIKQNQKLYYLSLQNADQQRDSTNFIEFMLEIIENSLEDLLKSQNLSHSNLERIEMFRELIGNKEFSRIEYLRHNKAISTATASRDLKDAVENGILEKVGDKRMTRYLYLKR